MVRDGVTVRAIADSGVFIHTQLHLFAANQFVQRSFLLQNSSSALLVCVLLHGGVEPL